MEGFPAEFQKVWKPAEDPDPDEWIQFDAADMILSVYDGNETDCYINAKFSEYVSHEGENFKLLNYFQLPPDTVYLRMFIEMDTLYIGGVTVADSLMLKLIDAGITKEQFQPDCNY